MNLDQDSEQTLQYEEDFNALIDSGLVGSTAFWEGYRESRRCSRDSYPESYITKYTIVRRLIRIPAGAELGRDGFLRGFHFFITRMKCKNCMPYYPIESERERARERERESERARERECVCHPPTLATPLGPKQLGVASLRRAEVQCTCGPVSPYSGRDCVKSLRSSYTRLYPQTGREGAHPRCRRSGERR